MLVILVVSCRITRQSEALDEPVTICESPLVPHGLQHLDATTLTSTLQPVLDIPLKSLLPKLDLEYLVEPCAVIGVASVRDALKLNTLALRDVGMGPKEQRIFSRGLERRVRLRMKLREAVSSAAGRSTLKSY